MRFVISINQTQIIITYYLYLRNKHLYLESFSHNFFGLNQRKIYLEGSLTSYSCYQLTSNYGMWTSVATKLRRSSKLRRFLSEDPSSSSSSVHFEASKILGRRMPRFFFEKFNNILNKIVWENVLFLKIWISIFTTKC